MIRLFKKQNVFVAPVAEEYSEPEWTPAVRTSICTGEAVAGFICNATGRFREFDLIRNDSDLEMFCRKYNVRRDALKKIY